MEWRARNRVRGERNSCEERQTSKGDKRSGSQKQVRRDGSEKGKECYMKTSEVKGV